MPDSELIRELLLNPSLVSQLSEHQWDIVVRQGRSANLLASLENRIRYLGFLDHVPSGPLMHLISAQKMVARQEVAMKWEVEYIQAALNESVDKIILLKGAAYLMAGLPTALGRVFSDVDILVEKTRLAEAESALMLKGWHAGHHDSYDDRYYRLWMHEIPPMRHVRRGTVIDVHHSILPETAKISVNVDALFENVTPISNNVFVLQPLDMFLHSATHLFHEGELDKGLRDLFDLDSLLREFSNSDGFWENMVPRAINLGLTSPLFYALRYTKLLLGTPIPEEVLLASEIAKPSGFVLSIMDFCYQKALRPIHETAEVHHEKLARRLIFVRSHWIKMPVHLLTYHLLRKFFLRFKKDDGEPELTPKNL